MKMKLSQFSPIITGGNGNHVVARGRLDGRNHGGGHCGFINPIDDNLVRALHTFVQLGGNAAPQCWAIGIGGRSRLTLTWPVGSTFS